MPCRSFVRLRAFRAKRAMCAPKVAQYRLRHLELRQRQVGREAAPLASRSGAVSMSVILFLSCGCCCCKRCCQRGIVPPLNALTRCEGRTSDVRGVQRLQSLPRATLFQAIVLKFGRQKSPNILPNRRTHTPPDPIQQKTKPTPPNSVPKGPNRLQPAPTPTSHPSPLPTQHPNRQL